MSLSRQLNRSDHVRPVPEGSGALVVLGFSWEEVIALLGPEIARIAPEVKLGQGIWDIRPATNGLKIVIYDDERPFFKDQAKRVADHPLGPQVHAGRLKEF